MSGELGWHHPANPDRDAEEKLREVEAEEAAVEREAVRVDWALRDEDVNRAG